MSVFIRIICFCFLTSIYTQSCLSNVCSGSFNLGEVAVNETAGSYSFDISSYIEDFLRIHGVNVESLETTCANASISSNGLITYPEPNDCAVRVTEISYPGSRSPDINEDGIVDDADLLRILFTFGNQDICLAEDIDYSGVVDDADLLSVLMCFGEDGSRCISRRKEQCSLTISLKHVRCSEINFRPFARSIDHNSRRIRSAALEILSFLENSRLGRSRRFSSHVSAAKDEIQRLFAENWNFLWANLPDKISSCETELTSIQCIEMNLTQIYNQIIFRNKQIKAVVMNLLQTYSRYLARRNLNRMLSILVNNLNSEIRDSVNFIKSLPNKSVECLGVNNLS